MLQKVCDRMKEFVSWAQAGFIRGRSCANNLWILRRVAERSIEFKVPVYCALVYYKGAFDALNRTTLGRVLNLFLSPSMVKRVLTLYFDAKAKVTLDSSVGPEFNLQRGVRQGCPASPSFFTIALSFISWSFRLTYEGIKLVTLHLSTLEYADDQILFTLTAGGMQSMLDFIVNNAEPFGLRLSPKKCELICFHCPGTINRNNLPRVSVGDRVLPWKQSVVYLGSRIAEDGNTLVAVKHRICCAETVIKRLDKRVFSRRNIDAKLKGHSLTLRFSHRFSMDSSTARLVRETNGVWMVSSWVSRNVYYICHSIITYPIWKQNNRLLSRDLLPACDVNVSDGLGTCCAVRTLYCMKR